MEARPCDVFDFDSLSPPNPSFVIPYKNGDFNFTAVSEFEPGTQEFESVHLDRNFSFYGPGEEEEEEEDYYEQMNFVTDLFGTRTRQGSPNERNSTQSMCTGFTFMDEEPDLVLGLESITVTSTDGLRIVDMDSESDSEAMEVDFGIDHDDGLDQNDDFASPGFWDCLQFDGQRERAEEFEWEEVNIRENLTSLIDRIEQLSFSSFSESSPFVTEEEEENARNVEWQVLLAVNNLDLGSGYDEYNVQFGELVEAESNIRGSPPAAKSVVDSLPSVVLTTEDLVESNVVCVVCKDDISTAVNVTKLPCCHHYHRDCILPWLAIRNTCPLCRHELPTDDVDYERRKNGNGSGTGLVDHNDLGV